MRKETVVDFDCFFVLLEEIVKHRRSSSRSLLLQLDLSQ
uniref:Uncharacterized protein n=1 Tax=Brassica campestris TaxID=3711 RepID=A0A3P5YV71_BRACM|nr:unnamed protein product [Brassica rapa]